jgi:peptidoglycan-N-acetylglucosamine deacetylase
MQPFYFTTSWDDGSLQDTRLADLLVRHQVPATFYIPRHADRPVLSESEIRRLSQQFEIGGHTINHVVLTRIPDHQAQQEVLSCKNWLEDVTGRHCSMFCFPAGNFATRHLQFVAEAGYAGARTVELMSVDRPRRSGGIALMPTTLQVFDHDCAAYLRNFAKRGAVRNLWTFAVHGHASRWFDSATRLLRRAALNGGVFHLWGHSWELDQYQHWSELERFFEFVRTSGLTPQNVVNSALCSRQLPA